MPGQAAGCRAPFSAAETQLSKLNNLRQDLSRRISDAEELLDQVKAQQQCVSTGLNSCGKLDLSQCDDSEKDVLQSYIERYKSQGPASQKPSNLTLENKSESSSSDNDHDSDTDSDDSATRNSYKGNLVELVEVSPQLCERSTADDPSNVSSPILKKDRASSDGNRTVATQLHGESCCYLPMNSDTENLEMSQPGGAGISADNTCSTEVLTTLEAREETPVLLSTGEARRRATGKNGANGLMSESSMTPSTEELPNNTKEVRTTIKSNIESDNASSSDQPAPSSVFLNALDVPIVVTVLVCVAITSLVYLFVF